ncbi:hypothetical protein SISNIDRAFT_471353 [Sistotremastrum niveocremeum HHB9708]|uniref:Uncharacterized protein n=1 Tax=Sistotremastrum niveocremeum HHB9708 TaxID=1314777 RepID=A0A164MRV9_9AGAM|nr:hypothetical protein SISNIDRAFT_471353 [Sistotremastrum niveocremeum HHB9708]
MCMSGSCCTPSPEPKSVGDIGFCDAILLSRGYNPRYLVQLWIALIGRGSIILTRLNDVGRFETETEAALTLLQYEMVEKTHCEFPSLYKPRSGNSAAVKSSVSVPDILALAELLIRRSPKLASVVYMSIEESWSFGDVSGPWHIYLRSHVGDAESRAIITSACRPIAYPQRAVDELTHRSSEESKPIEHSSNARNKQTLEVENALRHVTLSSPPQPHRGYILLAMKAQTRHPILKPLFRGLL